MDSSTKNISEEASTAAISMKANENDYKRMLDDDDEDAVFMELNF